MEIRIGTRKSALARTQSQWVLSRIEARGLSCRLVEIVSEGDRDRTTPLYEVEGQSPGLFTKQLEEALLRGEIDVAVHSLKDLPTEQPPGLAIVAIPERERVGDCLILAPAKHDPNAPLGLIPGASVGTSSLRREAQIRHVRPDLNPIPIRGNVPTRVESVRAGDVDAVVLAQAGLARLGLTPSDLVRIDLPPDLFVPAPGQGALAIEARSDAPAELLAVLGRLNDRDAVLETRVERRILRELHGGCTLPLGVECKQISGNIEVRAFLGLFATGPGGTREWRSFETWQGRGPDEDALVREAVGHFKNLMAAASR